MRMRPVTVVGAMTTVLTIAGLAMAMVVPSAGTAAPRLPKVDLSTNAAVQNYLRSVGIDPATVVIQRGLNNYAGPNCPGLGWNCTTSTRAVQVAAAGGQNKFTCDPAFGDPAPFPLPGTVTNPSTNTCVIVQDATLTGAQNHARCLIHTSMPTATCHVLQQNATGDNFFQGHQRIRQTSGPDQDGHIDLNLHQFNVSGNNHAHSLMQIFQSTSEVSGSGTQDQNGSFDASPWEQSTETGNNVGHLTQTLNQDGRAKGGPSVSQTQFGDHLGDVDQFAEPAVDIAQATGSAGFSKFFASQSETQTLTGPGSQSQTGPQRCCGVGTQTGDPAQTEFNIDQSSTQNASQFGAGNVSQSQDIHGDCNTTGTCTIHHNVTNEVGSENEQRSGTGVVTLNTFCFAFSGEGEGGACPDEGG
jgi:hypothetical protein